MAKVGAEASVLGSILAEVLLGAKQGCGGKVEGWQGLVSPEQAWSLTLSHHRNAAGSPPPQVCWWPKPYSPLGLVSVVLVVFERGLITRQVQKGPWNLQVP